MNSQSSETEGREAVENQETSAVDMKAVNEIPRAKPTGKNAKQARDEAYWDKRQFRVQRTIAYAGVLGIIIYGLQLWEMRKSTDAATKAANSAEQGLALTRDNLDVTSKSIALTANSVELTQKSTELSQKTIELTQKGLEATQEALKYASKANEISEKGMEAANTPWIDVTVRDVIYNGADGIFIYYALQNHADSPAPQVSSQCYLEHAGVAYIDEGVFSSSNLAVMPHQPVAIRASLMVSGGDPKTTVKQIHQAKVGIKIYVSIVATTGKKTSFVETFYKRGRIFAISNMQFNPSWRDVEKMIHESANPKRKK